MEDAIRIRGCRAHNLKNVDIDIPLGKLICVYGPSGSGKSSLFFHALLKESRRRFLNCLGSSGRFFSDRPPAVDVDEITPVLPVFGLKQYNPVLTSRSNVSDVMGLTEIIQGLYHHFAFPYCPDHNERAISLEVEAQLKKLLAQLGERDVVHLLISRDDFLSNFQNAPLPSRSQSKRGGDIRSFNRDDPMWELGRFRAKTFFVDPMRVLDLIQGSGHAQIEVFIAKSNEQTRLVRDKMPQCPVCERSVEGQKSAELFSPYNAKGACTECQGHGAILDYDLDRFTDPKLTIANGGIRILEFGPLKKLLESFKKDAKVLGLNFKLPIEELDQDVLRELLLEGGDTFPGVEKAIHYLERKKYRPAVRVFMRKVKSEKTCESCGGTRIKQKAHHFKVPFREKLLDLPSSESWTIADASRFVRQGPGAWGETARGKRIYAKLNALLKLGVDIGLGHVGLFRKTKTLSASEYQRLLILKYLGHEGTDSLFVFDEPGLGLSEQECEALLQGFRNIVRQGNTAVVIDHSEFFRRHADHVIKVGPGPGPEGGEIVYSGDFNSDCLDPNVEVKSRELPKSAKWFKVSELTVRDLSFFDQKFPIGHMSLYYGQSGQGKRSFFLHGLASRFHLELTGERMFEFNTSYQGDSNQFSKVVVCSAGHFRTNRRSSFGSFTELAVPVRKYLAELPDSRALGLEKGHFSTNSELGQCPHCKGRGEIIVEMPYMEDIQLMCEDCGGRRLRPEYGRITDGVLSAWEFFQKPVSEVMDRITLTPKFRRAMMGLRDLQLDYLSLDRELSSLSGGEKQRLSLFQQTQKAMKGALIVLDNISFGLSPRELEGVYYYLARLVQDGNTVILIDQSPLLRKWIPHSIEFSRKN